MLPFSLGHSKLFLCMNACAIMPDVQSRSGCRTILRSVFSVLCFRQNIGQIFQASVLGHLCILQASAAMFERFFDGASVTRVPCWCRKWSRTASIRSTTLPWPRSCAGLRNIAKPKNGPPPCVGCREVSILGMFLRAISLFGEPEDNEGNLRKRLVQLSSQGQLAGGAGVHSRAQGCHSVSLDVIYPRSGAFSCTLHVCPKCQVLSLSLRHSWRLGSGVESSFGVGCVSESLAYDCGTLRSNPE